MSRFLLLGIWLCGCSSTVQHLSCQKQLELVGSKYQEYRFSRTGGSIKKYSICIGFPCSSFPGSSKDPSITSRNQCCQLCERSNTCQHFKFFTSTKQKFRSRKGCELSDTWSANSTLMLFASTGRKCGYCHRHSLDLTKYNEDVATQPDSQGPYKGFETFEHELGAHFEETDPEFIGTLVNVAEVGFGAVFTTGNHGRFTKLGTARVTIVLALFTATIDFATPDEPEPAIRLAEEVSNALMGLEGRISEALDDLKLQIAVTKLSDIRPRIAVVQRKLQSFYSLDTSLPNCFNITSCRNPIVKERQEALKSMLDNQMAEVHDSFPSKDDLQGTYEKSSPFFFDAVIDAAHLHLTLIGELLRYTSMRKLIREAKKIQNKPKWVQRLYKQGKRQPVRDMLYGQYMRDYFKMWTEYGVKYLKQAELYRSSTIVDRMKFVVKKDDEPVTSCGQTLESTAKVEDKFTGETIYTTTMTWTGINSWSARLSGHDGGFYKDSIYNHVYNDYSRKVEQLTTDYVNKRYTNLYNRVYSIRKRISETTLDIEMYSDDGVIPPPGLQTASHIDVSSTVTKKMPSLANTAVLVLNLVLYWYFN